MSILSGEVLGLRIKNMKAKDGLVRRLQNTLTVSLQRGKTPPTSVLWPIRLRLQNIPTASLQSGKTPPTSILDMTLNNLMVILQ